MGTGKIIQADNIDGLKTVKNFISNGNATLNTSGWVTYKDAAGTRPVDGTGGSPTLVTFTRTTTSPLDDAASFLFSVAGGSSAQGEGASFGFTIGSAYKAKVLKIEADYIVNSGTFAAGSNTTASDVIVYIYDVTNGVLIEPSSFKFLSNSSTISDKFSATFQTASNSTSYRLILHVASASTQAYSLKFDNLAVSPSNYVYGTTITDWQSYTPTYTNAPTGNSSFKWRRIGDSVQIDGTFVATGSGPAGTFTISLPSGLEVDTTKISGVYTTQGVAKLFDSGVNNYTGVSSWSTSPKGIVIQLDSSGNIVQGPAFTVNDSASVNIMLPILGWSSSVQVSDGYDGRVAAVSAYGSGSITSGTTPNILNLGTTVVDKTNSLASNTFTVPSAGDYSFTAHFQGNSASGQQMLSIFVDGVEQTNFTSQISMLANGQRQTISGILPLKSGQLVTIRGWQNSGSAVSMNSSFNIQKLAGNPVISASETVGALYTGAPPTGTLGASWNTVTFGTKVKDSHGAYSGGVYTVPVSGQYDISAQICLNATYTSGNIAGISVFVDGVEKYVQNVVWSGASTLTNIYPPINVKCIPLIAGQVLTIRSYVQGSTPAFTPLAQVNFFSITRSGGY